MAGEKGGKDLLLKIDTDGAENYQTLGGLTTKSMTLNNGEIDVTNHSSNQWRTLLDQKGIRAMDLSGSGVHNGDGSTLNTAEDACINGTLTRFQIVDDDAGRTYTAYFKVTSFERSGEHNGPQNYSLSMLSSGDVTIS